MKKTVVKMTQRSCQLERMPNNTNNGNNHSRYQGWMTGDSTTMAAKDQVARAKMCSVLPQNINTSTTTTESTRPANRTADITSSPSPQPSSTMMIRANSPRPPTGAQ